MDGWPPYCFLLVLAAPFLCYFVKLRSSTSTKDAALLLPPGPWQLPVLGSLHHLRGAGGLPHRALRDLSRRHGPLMFLKLGEVSVVVASSREAAEEVMKTHDIAFASRPRTPTGGVSTRQGPDIVLAPYGDLWRQLRKIAVHELLSAKRVQSFRPVREREAMRLVEAVWSNASAAGPNRAINLTELVASYANDVTWRAVVGDRPVGSDRDVLLRYVAEAFRLAGSFRLADLFPTSRLSGAMSRRGMRRTEADVDRLFKLMDAVIAQHLERNNTSATTTHKEGEHQEEEQGLIDVLLRIQREGYLRSPISMATVKGVLFVLIYKRQQVGSSSRRDRKFDVGSAVGYVRADEEPVSHVQAQAEVRAAFVGGSKVTEEGLSELSYLRCVVKETLRLHPPAPLVVPRECRETRRIMGYDVPQGATVLVNAWAISRDPACWPDAPETFRPERFESGGSGVEARDFRGRDFEFTPFGAGRRMCPGILFGVAAIELALAHLIFHFDWSLPEDIGDVAELDMAESTGIIATRKKDLWLKSTLHVPFVSVNNN